MTLEALLAKTRLCEQAVDEMTRLQVEMRAVTRQMWEARTLVGKLQSNAAAAKLRIEKLEQAMAATERDARGLRTDVQSVRAELALAVEQRCKSVQEREALEQELQRAIEREDSERTLRLGAESKIKGAHSSTSHVEEQIENLQADLDRAKKSFVQINDAFRQERAKRQRAEENELVLSERTARAEQAVRLQQDAVEQVADGSGNEKEQLRRETHARIWAEAGVKAAQEKAEALHEKLKELTAQVNAKDDALVSATLRNMRLACLVDDDEDAGECEALVRKAAEVVTHARRAPREATIDEPPPSD